jgi:hypothetical protein
MKLFKWRRDAKGASGTVTVTVEIPQDAVGTKVTTVGHGGSGVERDPLHAHEITADDAALIRMMAGAHFRGDVTGKTITGAEMQRWVESQEDS